MTAEQQARDMLERMGIENAQSFTAGELVELADIIAERNAMAKILRDARQYVERARIEAEAKHDNPESGSYDEGALYEVFRGAAEVVRRIDTLLPSVSDANTE